MYVCMYMYVWVLKGGNNALRPFPFQQLIICKIRIQQVSVTVLLRSALHMRRKCRSECSEAGFFSTSVRDASSFERGTVAVMLYSSAYLSLPGFRCCDNMGSTSGVVTFF